MARSTKVKCKYCGQTFDRAITEFVKISNRYAHATCHNKAQAEAADLRTLTDLIKELYAPKEPNWGLLGKQIKKYRDEGMTYMGMYYTLVYFFVVQKNDLDKGKGVGIIPYVYDRAKAYYKNSTDTYAKAATVNQQSSLDVQQTGNVITLVHKKPKKKLIDFNYEE